VTGALVADTGGLLRALARTPGGDAAWPEYEAAFLSSREVIVPSLVLAEVDYFLREERATMRRLVAEIFDPATTYSFEPVHPADIVRALHIDAKFADLSLGLVDCAVATIAERRRTLRVLTTDRRDFAALRVGERYDRPLTLLP
jgi:predicted nucleic acid-binding protein